jgi:uncharacterized membrane protein YkvA (DUF1232 family)
MLRALKNQLMQLSRNPDDAFAKIVTERLNFPSRTEPVDQLRNFVLTLPHMINQIQAWADNPLIPSQVRHLNGFVLTYLYHPADLVSEESGGLIGYLDDAYLVGCVYLLTMPQADANSYPQFHDSNNLTSQIPGWLSLTRRVLPEETKMIDKMIDELMTDKRVLFEQIMAQSLRPMVL